MFFALGKIAGFFTHPSNLLVVLAIGSFALTLTPFARLGRIALCASLIAIAVVGWSPLGSLLIHPLEQRFPPWDANRGAPDGIIILGGSIAPDVSNFRGEAALNESAERLTGVAGLARRFPDARIVFTGGNSDIFASERTEAQFAIEVLESFGIPRTRIALEGRSRTTLENAAFTKALVSPKTGERWLLVTSAYHMPRAIGVFRAAGFPVEAYPVDWRTGDDLLQPFDKASDGLKRTDTALHEWAGLFGYWITGKTRELFPAPR